jgi:hypothetical protein
MESLRSIFIVGALPAIISFAMTLFSYAILLAAMWKLFQIASDLAEIKTLLANQRNIPAPPAPSYHPVAPAPGPISLESAEALLREVAAESHGAAAQPAKPVAQ